MKFTKLFLIIIIAALSAIPVFAGGGSASVISVSSDCESVTVTYEIIQAYGYDWGLTSTGYAGEYDIPDSIHTATVTFPITPQVPGTSITVILKHDVISNIASKTVNCSSSGTGGIAIGDEGAHWINDGRVEPFATDMVIYPLNDGIVIYSDEGDMMLFIAADTIEMIGIPDGDPRLLGETLDGYVQIFRMSDGRFQANVGPDGEGKIHVVVWEGLGYVLFDTVENSNYQ